MAVRSENMAVQVLRALGLSAERCLSLTLHFEVGNIVRAEAEYAPDEEGVGGMVNVLHSVRLKAEPADEGETS